MHMFYGWGSGWGWNPAMFLAMIIPLLILGLVIYWAVYAGNRNAAGKIETPLASSPMEILKIRYARGEIDSQEYHRLKEEIQKE